MATLGNEDSALRDFDDASDVDSDTELLEDDIAKLNESVREFLATQHGEDGQQRIVPRGRGGARGPRKAAKVRGDIAARLSKVNQAFLSGDYDRALDLAFEVIRINAEIHQAWITVASIFREQGDVRKALSAMIYAAHLRPRDVNGWLQCASFAVDAAEVDEADNLQKARVCYSAALRANPNSLEARVGKASVCHRQGHMSAAIAEYKLVLRARPYDLEIIRRLAEACVDNKNSDAVIPAAISAYERYFEHEKLRVDHQLVGAPWQDIGIYVDLYASMGRFAEALRELKTLSRWFVGRGAEEYWDALQDDREWDADDGRRAFIPEFHTNPSDVSLYGQALPHDLRARLAIYRARLHNDEEVMKHLLWLDPSSEHTREFAADFPDLIFDIADALSFCGQTPAAITYYEILRDLPGETDAIISLHLGRCFLTIGDSALAEEYFLAALDADEDNIEARIELANMYEKAREDEEALILAAEAMALREARQEGSPTLSDAEGASSAALHSEIRARRRREAAGRSEPRTSKPRKITARSLLPRRYRPKRLAGADKRRQDEQARALKLTEQYEIVRDLRQKINAGQHDLIPTWMESSKELIDDFRSLKKFYTWEKYLNFLGPRRHLDNPVVEQHKNELSRMYERLARTLAPHGQDGEERPMHHDSHQGISFDKWLDLFLDYAIGLAIAHRREEAYQVCEAARDSTAFRTTQHSFMIHVAWGVCAIYTSDEEKCVATARQLMRDGAMSDSYRMFALLSSLCQSPVSWYTSGPAQKYILRQIKAIDDAQIAAAGAEDAKQAANVPVKDLAIDACLLMLYGHILFTSTSYTFALGYFLRARTLDPDNAMVNLSLGLAYVHYGLKRQSTNRQYLLLQGQMFLSRYAELSHGTTPSGNSALAESYYNLGRLYQLLGINYLAYEFYAKAREVTKAEGGHPGIEAITYNNELMSLLNNKNNETALALLRDKIRI